MGYIVAHHSLLTGDLTYLRHDGVVFLLYFYDVSEIDTAHPLASSWCGSAIRLQSNGNILTKANPPLTPLRSLLSGEGSFIEIQRVANLRRYSLTEGVS